MPKTRTSFTREAARRAHRRRLGLRAAKTNRLTGFENLKRGRAVHSLNAARRRRERVRELAAQIHLMAWSPSSRDRVLRPQERGR
jgi:hypothetical protein